MELTVYPFCNLHGPLTGIFDSYVMFSQWESAWILHNFKDKDYIEIQTVNDLNSLDFIHVSENQPVNVFPEFFYSLSKNDARLLWKELTEKGYYRLNIKKRNQTLKKFFNTTNVRSINEFSKV